MKRNLPFASMAAALLLFSIAAGSVDALKTGAFITTDVNIDGVSFRSDDARSSDSALFHRELAKLGVEIREPFDFPPETQAAKPVFSGRLAGSHEALPALRPDVPRGLTVDHWMRMSGANRDIELAFGKLDASGAAAVRLQGDGFTPVSAQGGSGAPRMLQKARGKETTVVCLDEKESSFLLLRRLDR